MFLLYILASLCFRHAPQTATNMTDWPGIPSAMGSTLPRNGTGVIFYDPPGDGDDGFPPRSSAMAPIFVKLNLVQILLGTAHGIPWRSLLDTDSDRLDGLLIEEPLRRSRSLLLRLPTIANSIVSVTVSTDATSNLQTIVTRVVGMDEGDFWLSIGGRKVTSMADVRENEVINIQLRLRGGQPTEDDSTVEEPADSQTENGEASRSTSPRDPLKRTRRRRAISMDHIRISLMDGCKCKNACHKEVDELTVLDLRQRVHMLMAGPTQQTRLLELYRTCRVHVDGQGQKYLVNGVFVCKYAWYYICLRISRASHFRIMKNLRRGYYAVVRQPALEGSLGAKGSIAKGFIQTYITTMGDRSPDSRRILLPVGLTKTEIYLQYKDMYKDTAVSLPYFFSIWQEHFTHVSIPKVRSCVKACRMKQCDVCMLAKATIASEVSHIERQALISRWKRHLQRQQNERETYYQRRARAEARQRDYLSLILDGMDQSKSNLPHFKGWTEPKSAGNARLETHITGAIVHGRNTYALIDLSQYPHDSNLAMNSLLHILVSEANNGPLPPTLNVQVDNCGRENKNRFFLGLMAFLVKTDYFEEITVNFLMVGHTHEDVDAVFSQFSHKLDRKDAKTTSELEEVLKSSFHPEPKVEQFVAIWDIKNWLKPYLAPIEGHSKPHMYRFTKDSRGHVTMQYKMWSTDTVWRPTTTDPDVLIFKEEEGRQMIPTGQPPLVEPHFEEEDLRKLKSSIEKMKDHLNYDQMQWWQTFLQNPTAIHDQPSTPPSWFLHHLLPYQPLPPEPPTSDEGQRTALQSLLNKELTCPPVSSHQRIQETTESTTDNKTEKEKRQWETTEE
ncbi:Hypp9281 [Branchiostoma lanceolatum]|uniref:Hypp9281 protein n=1 Tax=Branchiostoma lanceolatum TaxID=7740 RepID=A0A8J9ZDG9_BRALA|nr:Hypp9281 [Branchiostoma lanceolatum]